MVKPLVILNGGHMNIDDSLIVSSLLQTWLIDIDGTIVKHNGYKIDGYDTLLPGGKEKFLRILRVIKSSCLLQEKKLTVKVKKYI